MKRLLRSAEGILCVALAVLLLLCLLCLGGMIYLEQAHLVFQNVTIELGQPLPPVSAFLTERGNPDRAYFVTPESEINLSKTGSQAITLSHNGMEKTVTLEIRDTTAPAVVSKADVYLPLGTEVQPEDLLDTVTDHAPVTVSFVGEFVLPEQHGTVVAQVQVTDASGNISTAACNIHYVWLKGAFALELGDTLTVDDLLLRQEDRELFTDQAAVDAINASGLGTYTVTSTYGQAQCQCVVTVQDTVAPELEVQPVQTEMGSAVSADAFVVSTWDISGEVTVDFLEQPDLQQAGVQTVTIIARDASGNQSTAEVQLDIRQDLTGPVFYGVDNMRVEIGSTPDYTLGVVATDNRDGHVEFTYDASQEDTSKSGGYHVTYTATDKAGNTTSIRRWIIVDHDQADIDALVTKYADQLSDDPVEIMNWCYQNIVYCSDWGNGDPVWYGFTKWRGNCYVHAYCLQAILDHKGYETQIIWTTEKTHYWVLVNIGGEGEEAVWRHIDSTPGNMHLGYGLMDDTHRLWTLSGGRVWDFDQWPACE